MYAQITQIFPKDCASFFDIVTHFNGLLDCFLVDVCSNKSPTKYEIYLPKIHSMTSIEQLVARLMFLLLKGKFTSHN